MINKDIFENLIRERFKNIRGIEIGTLRGETAMHLLDRFRNLELFAIDKLPDRITLANNIQQFNERIRIIELPSDKAYRLFDSDIDFVWIDGDHEYEQVKRDIKNYLPLVRKGGFIGGHDYGSPDYTGVKKAVDESFEKEKLNIGEDFTWWIFL